MSTEPPASEEDRFAEVLAAWDGFLAGDTASGRPEAPDLPPDLQPRLERDLACLKLLRGVLRPAPSSREPANRRLGRFEIRRELGRGAHGVVFLAHDPQLGRAVALKIPRPEALAAPELRERFLREARAAAGLDHPNLVPVYEAGAVGEVCFIAAAYCPGPTLADWLRQQNGPAPPRPAAALVATLAEAIHHAHAKGVLHRDLKPSNVLLAFSDASQKRPGELAFSDASQKRSGEQRFCEASLNDYVPKIADFGLAKLVADDADQTQTGVILGTPCYMAPEQAEGRARDAGAAADVYSLGAILYELLTGRPPFRGETTLDTLEQVRSQEPLPPSRLASKLPRDLETVCLKCLRKEPKKRYTSGLELADDLRRFLAGRPVLARPTGAAERAWKWTRRRPALAALVAVSVLAVAGLLAGGLWHNVRLEAERDNALLQKQIASEREVEAERLRGVAEERTRTARRHLYAAHLNLAQVAWEAGRVGRVLDLLKGQQPRPGEEDLRGFEWHYLHHLCHGEQFCWAGWKRSAAAAMPGRAAPALAPDGQMGRPAVTADGRLAATAEGADVVLWDVASGRRRTTLHGHLGRVRALCFAADGRTLASAGADGTALLWDVGGGRPRAAFGPRLFSIGAVALSADGRWLATAGADCAVNLWDVASHRPRATLRAGSNGSAVLMLFAPDSRTLAIVSRDGPNRVQLWDVPQGTRRAILERHTDAVTAVVFAPDSKTVATRSDDRTASVWDTATGQKITHFSVLDPEGWVTCLVFAPDGRTFAAGVARPFAPLAPGRVRLWAVGSQKPLGVWEIEAGGPWALAFAPDGKTLAAGGDDGGIRLWDLPSKRSRGILRGHSGRVHHLAFTPDAKALTSMSLFDGTLRQWRPNPRPAPVVLEGHTPKAYCVAFAPDGAWVSGGDDGLLKFRDPVTGCEHRQLDARAGPVRSAAFSPDGKTLAAANGAGHVALWDRATGTVRRQLALGGCIPWCVRYSADGRLLAASADVEGDRPRSELCLWDATTGAERGRWSGGERIWSVAFSADGRLLAWADDSTVRVWDLAADRERFRRKTNDNFMAVAFGPPGKYGRVLAAGSWSHAVWLWDLESGRERTLEGHGGPVLGVAFAPDGKVLATGSHDGTVRLWDPASGQQRFVLTGRRAMIEAVAFSPDGLTLVAALKDGRVQCWEAAAASSGQGQQLEEVVAHLRSCNPGFDGQLLPRIEKGTVTSVELSADEVTDLSPLRALKGLRRLHCNGTGPSRAKLRDLSPLRGLPLTELACASTNVSDLSPLADMPLTSLNCNATAVSDLAPLAGMPLEVLHCDWTRVADLSRLKAPRLKVLSCSGTGVSDLGPVRGLHLTHLSIGRTGVTDLSPLRGMPLKLLYGYNTRISDLSPLRGMPLHTLALGDTRVADLEPLHDMPLTLLYVYRARVTDLSPLRGLPLKEVSCDIRSERDLELLRSPKTLETINGQPAAAFWKARAAAPTHKP